MLVEIPPKMSVSGFMGYLKGKSSLMLYEQFGDLKFKYRNREFWCRGYYVDTDKIEKDCEESIEACNLAARRFTDNGALLDSMLEPYADMLSKIGNN
ncbi:transposase-like protein [Cooperia oncophora]